MSAKASTFSNITTITDDADDFVPILEDVTGTPLNKKITVDNFFKGTRSFPIPVSGMFRKTTAGPSEALTQEETSTNKINTQQFNFDQSTDEGVQVGFPLPEEYDGSTINVKFYWKCGLTTGNAVLACKGISYGDDEALDTAMGTAQSVTDGAGSGADDIMISAYTSAITLAGTPAAGEWCQLEIFRDADNGSDTLAGDLELLGIMVRIGINKKDAS